MSFVSVLVSLIKYSDAEHYFLTKEYLKRELLDIYELVDLILHPSRYPLCIHYPVTIRAYKKADTATFIHYNLYEPLISIVRLLFNMDSRFSREIVLDKITSLTGRGNFSYYYSIRGYLNGPQCSSIGDLLNDNNLCISLENALKRIIQNSENIILKYH